MPKTYYCDCQAKCKGERKQVSKATYFRHEPFRDPYSRFSSRLQDVFRSNPIIYAVSSTTSGGSGISTGASVPSTTASEPASVPRDVQTQGPATDSHREGHHVRAFGIGILGKTDSMNPGFCDRIS